MRNVSSSISMLGEPLRHCNRDGHSLRTPVLESRGQWCSFHSLAHAGGECVTTQEEARTRHLLAPPQVAGARLLLHHTLVLRRPPGLGTRQGRQSARLGDVGALLILDGLLVQLCSGEAGKTQRRSAWLSCTCQVGDRAIINATATSQCAMASAPGVELQPYRLGRGCRARGSA